MLPSAYTEHSPGEIVKAWFDERTFRDGKEVSERVEGWAFVPHGLPPKMTMGEVTEAVFDDLIDAERSLARLDGIGEDEQLTRLLWAPLAQRETILSSKIENTIATGAELALFEAGDHPARDEIKEVNNYTTALHFGLESKLPLCLRLIRGMHERLLSGGVRGSDMTPGEFRTTQNYIGDPTRGFANARFVPPPPGEHLRDCLHALETYANTRKFGLPKLVAIALMHYQFEAIHPFSDGNGRVGRLLSALSLVRMNLISKPFVYLSGYLEPKRDRYTELLLRVSTHGEWMPWIKFFMKAVASQSQDTEARIRELRDLRQRYRDALSSQSAPSKAFVLVDEIFVHPAVTADRVAKKLEVTKPTARSYIEKLVSIGALSEYPKNYRKMWIAPEVIACIDAPPRST